MAKARLSTRPRERPLQWLSAKLLVEPQSGRTFPLWVYSAWPNILRRPVRTANNSSSPRTRNGRLRRAGSLRNGNGLGTHLMPPRPLENLELPAYPGARLPRQHRYYVGRGDSN